MGGVTLIYRSSDLFTIENEKVRGPNIVTFDLVLGKGKRTERWFTVGGYIPPSERDGATGRQIEELVASRPAGSRPLILADLNANLDFPRNRQEEIISGGAAEHGLVCATRHFMARRTRRNRGRWTWRQQRRDGGGETRTYRSKPDYILTRERDRRKVRRVRWVQLRGLHADHRALVIKLRSDAKGVEAHKRRTERNPLLEPRVGPPTLGEALFDDLRSACQKPERRERPDHSWIRPGTWGLIHRRAELRNAGQMPRREGFKLGRDIKNALKQDRIERARRAGEQAVLHLGDGNVIEAWRSLRGWYRSAGDRPPTPCRLAMETQTEEREKLYGYVESPGDHIPRNIERPRLDDSAPSDDEIRRAVRKSNNGRSGGGHTDEG